MLAQSIDQSAQPIDEAYPALRPRELSVLSETLSAEEIDRAVLNRLMGEISREPATTKTRLGVDDRQLQEIFVTLSNARGFINGSEMQNVAAMCGAWNSSSQSGDARIAEALAAYSAREQHTKAFIAKYYAIVLYDIESLLNASSRSLLASYMEDRRRRMANAGTTSWGSPVQNIRSGTDTIAFHCR